MATRSNRDFSPVYRSSIGFDRTFDLLENAAHLQAGDHLPPYDIVKTGEDDYRISMAVAGFEPDELEITQEPNMLVVSGANPEDDTVEYLHRDIDPRLLDLPITSRSRVPACMIEIIAGDAATRRFPRQIEDQKVAA